MLEEFNNQKGEGPMKTMLVTVLVLSMAMVACGKGGKGEEKKGEEPLACQMTKAEAEAIAKKIKDAEKKKQDFLDAFFKQDPNTRKYEDLTESLKYSGPIMAMSAGIEEVVKSLEKGVFPDQLIALRYSLAFNVAIVIVFTGREAEKKGEKYVQVIQDQRKVLESYGYLKIVGCMMKNIEQKAPKLDKAKYPKTLELYAMTVRLYNTLLDPRGTFDQIKKNNDEIRQEAEKIEPLVELEWK